MCSHQNGVSTGTNLHLEFIYIYKNEEQKMFEAASIENGYTDLANYFFKLFVITGTMFEKTSRKSQKIGNTDFFYLRLFSLAILINLEQNALIIKFEIMQTYFCEVYRIQFAMMI